MDRIANTLGLLLCLCACSQSRPPANYTLVLEGKVALDTPIRSVQLDVVDESPEFPGKVWASAFSAEGEFSFSFVTPSFGPFRIVARVSENMEHGEPTYTDNTTGAVVSFRPKRSLETMFYIADRRDTTYKNVAVNALTSLASWTASAYIQGGRDWDEATRTSHRLWSDYIYPDGNYDVRFAQGKNANDLLQGALNMPDRVALFHGGLSRLAVESAIKASNTFYGIDTLRRLREDLSNGVLEGSNIAGERVFMSTSRAVLLNDDTLRGTLARAIESWLTNEPLAGRAQAMNATGLTPEKLSTSQFLPAIAGNDSELFGETRAPAPSIIDIQVDNNQAAGIRQVVGGPNFSEFVRLGVTLSPGADNIPLKEVALYFQVTDGAQDCVVAGEGLSEPEHISEAQFTQYTLALGSQFTTHSIEIGVGGACNAITHVKVVAEDITGVTNEQRVRVDVDTTAPRIVWDYYAIYEAETLPVRDSGQITGFETERRPLFVGGTTVLIEKYVSTLDYLPPYSINTPTIPMTGLDPGPSGTSENLLEGYYCYAPPDTPTRCNSEENWRNLPASSDPEYRWELRVSYQDLASEIILHGEEEEQVVHVRVADEAKNVASDTFAFRLRAKLPKIAITCEDLKDSPSTVGEVATTKAGPVEQEKMTLSYSDFVIPLPEGSGLVSKVPAQPLRLHVGS